jgi:hypothetical protein
MPYFTHSFSLAVRCLHLNFADAKLAFAGDEGAGIQVAVEGGVYADEERWYG